MPNGQTFEGGEPLWAQEANPQPEKKEPTAFEKMVGPIKAKTAETLAKVDPAIAETMKTIATTGIDFAKATSWFLFPAGIALGMATGVELAKSLEQYQSEIVSVLGGVALIISPFIGAGAGALTAEIVKGGLQFIRNKIISPKEEEAKADAAFEAERQRRLNRTTLDEIKLQQ